MGGHANRVDGQAVGRVHNPEPRAIVHDNSSFAVNAQGLSLGDNQCT